jgi:hypothetical protein
MARTSTRNPQEKPINQRRGPTVGNENPGSKRSEFVRAKSSGEKVALADFITSALSGRGQAMKPSITPGLENLSPNSARNTGISRNVTADGARLPSKYKSPIRRG